MYGIKESRIIACPGDLAMLGLILYGNRLAGAGSKSMAIAQGSCDLSAWTFFQDAVVVCMASFSRKAE
ncbi:hypothetical protein THH46_19455 [Pseudomonas sp. NA13]